MTKIITRSRKRRAGLTAMAVLYAFASTAQTTEVFETETASSTSFTDNGQTFNITTQSAGNTFDIYDSGGSLYGWSGSAADSRFIDNSGSVTSFPVQFTITSGSPFIINNLWLYLANAAANNNVTGSLTITGKLGGTTVYTATASTGFNTTMTNNGFSLINLGTFGSQNNSNMVVDEFVINTGGNFVYVALDAFNWTKPAPEINIQGNSTSISDGDATPSTADHTDFGSQSVCAGTIVRTFTIQNTGNTNLTITSVSITGSAAADYSLTTAPSSTVAAGASTIFQVTLNPSAAGARTATITVNNNDANEAAYDFAITGTGTDPEINLQGNSTTIADGDATPSTTDHTDFGSQSVCSGTIVRTFTIQNTGTSNLTISSVNITGTAAADYSITIAPSATVIAGGSAAFQVTFNPSAAGARNATITINNSDCDEAAYDFAITGTGTDPEINVQGNSTTIADGDITPIVVDHTSFGSTGVCSGTVVRTFTIQNTGSSNLTISGAVSITGTAAGDYTVTTAPTSPIAAGGSTTFQVTFNPSAAGARNATIAINNNDCDEGVYDFAITGTGTDAEINVQGNSTTIADGDATPSTTDHTDFGSQSVCSGTVVRTFTIQNTGTSILNIVSVNITGTAAADYSLTTAPAATVAASGSTTFQVTFNPSATGSRDATITINNDDCDEAAYDFAITGTGTDAEINVQGNSTTIADGDATPATADHTDFGSVDACVGTIVRTFTIQNTGTSTLNVSSVNITGTAAADYSLTTVPAATVAASGSTTFQVTFDPSTTGARNATITVNTDDCDEAAYDFALTGTGAVDVIPPTTPTIANATGECSVTPTAPTTTDNCAGTITGTTTTTFPITTQGTTVVTWTFNDGNGNITTANQNVIVDDVTNPVTPTIANATGQCSVTPTAPTTTDNCAGTITGTTTTTFPITTQGTTVVTWTFNDGNGNVITANQNVIVDDVTNPVTPTIANATGQCSVTPTAPTTTDNCAGTITGTTTTTFPITTQGTTVVTWTFNDGNGNVITANQNVIVDDVTNPVTPTIANATGQCSVTPTAPTTTDNCAGTITGTTTTTFPITTQGTTVVTWTFNDGNGNVITANQNVIVDDVTNPVTPTIANATGQCSVTPTAPTTTDNCAGTITGTTTTTFPITTQGTTVVTWTFNDGNGNVITANQNVIVDDVTNPVTPTIANATGQCSVTPTAPTTTDNCAGTITGTTTTTFPITTQGTTVVTWTFNDGNGNVTTANQNVIVDDITAPAVPTLANVTGECSVTPTAPTTTDNCAGTITGTTTTTFPITTQGTTVVTWTFNDGNGNISTANQNVIVDDITAPAVPTLSNATGECSVTPTAPTTTDNCAGTITGTTTTTFPITTQGTTVVTWTFNDGNGNISTASQNVIVDDITAPAVPTLSNATGECSVTPTAPTTTDNCAGTITGTTTTTFPITTQGTTVVTWTFNDGNGNVITANQNVIIDDITAPVTPTLANATGECSVTPSAPTTTDNCAGTITGTTTTTFPITTQGTTVVTWTFDDGNGNVTTADQNVIIDDVTSPVVSGCPANISIATNNTGCTGMATWTAPTATDNCSGTVITSSTHDPGDVFAVGTTTVTYTFDDGNGNTSTCSFDVTVTNDFAIVSAVTTNVTCNGGSDGAINLTLAGGTLPYTSDWNSGMFATENLTGLTAGTYAYTGTDNNGCTVSTVVTVTEPTAISIVVDGSTNPLTCGASNGTISVTVSGGMTGYTYSWTDGDAYNSTVEDPTDAPAGNIMLTVTDGNGCTATQTVSLSDPFGPVISYNTASSDTTVDCNGDMSANINIDVVLGGGATSATYDWNSGMFTTEDINGLGAGTYSVSVTDNNGCTSSAVYNVIEPAAIDVSTTTVTATITANYSGPGTYQWIDCATMAPIAGETGQSFTATADGDYAVIISEGLCADTSACVNITGLTVGAVNTIASTVVYPNPAQNVLNIRSERSMMKVNITDLSGKNVMGFEGNTNTIHLETIARGMYLLVIRYTDGSAQSIPFVVEK